MNLKEKLEELLKVENPSEDQLAEINNLKNQIAEDEVQKRIQSEADKVRGKYAKDLKDLQAQLEALKNEKLTEEEKAQKEKEDKEKALLEREAQLQKKELDFDTLSLLNEKKLGKEFLNFLSGKDIETRTQQLEVLENLINNKIQEAVKEKLGQEPKPSGGTGGGLSITKADFEKMSFQEKTSLYLTDPELYNKLK